MTRSANFHGQTRLYLEETKLSFLPNAIKFALNFAGSQNIGFSISTNVLRILEKLYTKFIRIYTKMQVYREHIIMLSWDKMPTHTGSINRGFFKQYQKKHLQVMVQTRHCHRPRPAQLHHSNQDQRTFSILVSEGIRYFQEFHDKMNTKPECSHFYIFLEAAFEQICSMPSEQNLQLRKKIKNYLNKWHLKHESSHLSNTRELCAQQVMNNHKTSTIVPMSTVNKNILGIP